MTTWSTCSLVTYQGEGNIGVHLAEFDVDRFGSAADTNGAAVWQIDDRTCGIPQEPVKQPVAWFGIASG